MEIEVELSSYKVVPSLIGTFRRGLGAQDLDLKVNYSLNEDKNTLNISGFSEYRTQIRQKLIGIPSTIRCALTVSLDLKDLDKVYDLFYEEVENPIPPTSQIFGKPVKEWDSVLYDGTVRELVYRLNRARKEDELEPLEAIFPYLRIISSTPNGAVSMNFLMSIESKKPISLENVNCSDLKKAIKGCTVPLFRELKEKEDEILSELEGVLESI